MSDSVYLHQRAAADYATAGDEARAAGELQKAERDQQKLERREYRVPPTPLP